MQVVRVKQIIVHPILINNLLFSGGSYFFRIFNNLVLFSILARLFSENIFGIISLLVMVSKIVQTVLDYGHRLLIVKELTIQPSLLSEIYLKKKITFKFIFFFIVSIPVFIYGWSNHFWEYSVGIILSVLLTGYLSAISNLQYAIFQSKHWFKYETYSVALLSVLLLLSVLVCFKFRSPELFFTLYTLAHFFQLLYGTWVLKNKTGLSLKSSFIPSLNASSFSVELKSAWVFAAIVTIELMFTSFDSFFVEAYYSLTDLGYFEAVKKVIVGLTIMSLIFNVALLPTVSRWSNNLNVKTRARIAWANLIVIFFGLITFAFYYFNNAFFVNLLLGERYKFLTTWDFHLFIFVISNYMRIVPGLFIIGAHKQMVRLKLTSLFLFFSVVLYYNLLSSHDVRDAVKLSAYIGLSLSVAYMFLFYYLLYFSKDLRMVTNGNMIE